MYQCPACGTAEISFWAKYASSYWSPAICPRCGRRWVTYYGLWQLLFPLLLAGFWLLLFSEGWLPWLALLLSFAALSWIATDRLGLRDISRYSGRGWRMLLLAVIGILLLVQAWFFRDQIVALVRGVF